MTERCTHPDTDVVIACPECDDTNVYRRDHAGGRNAATGRGAEFVCYSCSWSGDEPNERPPTAPSDAARRSWPTSSGARALLKADAEEVP